MKKNKISKNWLKKQKRDIFFKQSKIHGYRSRSAFKLIEMDKKFKFLNKNTNLLDLGCSPGGWTQVASEKIKNGSPSTRIYIQTIFPINNQYYMNVKMVDYSFLRNDYSPSVNAQINEVNLILNNNNKFKVLDLHKHFLNNLNILDPIYSIDGVHLNQNGYRVWADKISHLIQKLNSKL